MTSRSPSIPAPEKVTIACSESQGKVCNNQLGDNVNRIPNMFAQQCVFNAAGTLASILPAVGQIARVGD